MKAQVLATAAEVKQQLKAGETLVVKNGLVVRGPTAAVVAFLAETEQGEDRT